MKNTSYILRIYLSFFIFHFIIFSFSFISHHHLAEPILEDSGICHRRILMDDGEDIPMTVVAFEIAGER